MTESADIIDLVHESVVGRDLSGRITLWNAAAEDLYGWTRAEAVGCSAADLLQCDDPGSFTETDAALFEAGSGEREFSRTTASGATILVDVRWSVRRDADGNPVEILEAGRNVADKRKVEESELRYRSIFNRMPIAFWQLDTRDLGDVFGRLRDEGVTSLIDYAAANPDFVSAALDMLKVTDVNDEAVRLMGARDRGDLIGPYSRLWSDRDAFLLSADARFRGAQTDSGISKLHAHDGRNLDVLWTSVFADSLSEVGVSFVGAIDVSDRREAVQGLARSEAKYKNLFNYMPIALWQLEAQELRDTFDGLQASGLGDIRAYVTEHPELLDKALASVAVTEVNAQAMKLFGAKDRETLLARMPSLWPDKNTYLEAALARLSGELHYSAETRIETIDGRRVDVLFSCAFTDRNNPESSNIIGAIDISERLRAESKLQQVQADFAHAARVATLGELTASIAHEINQPLAAITTSGEASLRWLSRPRPNIDEVRTLMENMVADARRAADVIARIRAMAARQLPDYQPLSVNSIIEEVLHFLRGEFQAHKLNVDVSLASHLPSVLADRTQLQQVLVNLVVNAIYAMAPQPTLQRRLNISTSARQGGGVRIDVEDSGPGIPESDMELLFDSFFTTKQSGLGIGLSICRSILEAHGGEINCENLPVGARFTLTLPASVGEPSLP
jgi:PAS domain S-box-containing protein